MKYQIRITQSAERDMRQNHAWWFVNRSEEQADRWLVEIDRFIKSLASTADRHRAATESALKSEGVRQANFGLSRLTHRILFKIENNVIVIYRIRAFAQAALSRDELN